MKSLFLLSASLVCVTSSAFAHVTANPNSGQAGDYFQTSFRISHGCDGSDTTAVKITLPPGTVNLKAQAKPGWKIDIEKHKLDKPVPAGHGKMADEEFVSVTWSGSTLPDAQYDEFGVLTKLPDTPGKTLWYPVTQTCVKGSQTWSEIPKDIKAWHDLKNPAPYVQITGKKSAEKNMHDMPGMDMPGMDRHSAQ